MTRTIQIRNPRTGANDYTIRPFDRAELEARCNQLRAGQAAWLALGVAGRAKAMLALCDAVDRHFDAILEALSADTGRHEMSVSEIEGLKGITRMRCATAEVCLCSSARGTTRLTMPIACARAASMRSPRNKNSLARRGAITNG